MKKEYESNKISIRDINYILSYYSSTENADDYENYEIFNEILNYSIDFRTKAEKRQDKINNLLKEI